MLTGAAGFVGRHLCAALVQAWPQAELLTTSFNLCDPAAIDAAVRAARPDACIHLAAVSTVAAARQDEFVAWRVNLLGSLHLARALLRHVPDCLLLYVSSSDTYGGAPLGSAAIDETRALAPRSTYAATKAAADLALGAMAGDGLHVVRLRPFNHTGPGQSPDLVIPAFARQVARIAAGRQPPVMQVGNLDVWRDFSDVRDVCRAYIACVERRTALNPGAIINIGAGQPRRIGDVLDDMLALAGVVAEVRIDRGRVRTSDPDRFCADNTRARALLDWSPAIPWQRTLHDILEDWRTRVAAEPEA